MKTAAPPHPPDPTALANAQTASNQKTATTQQQLNMVGQNTPYGSLSYQQVGTWPDGTPRYEATTTLSPEEQGKQQQQWEFDKLVNNLGIQQTKQLTDLLGNPIRLGNEPAEARLAELGRARLDPVFSQRRGALETQLRNQGFAPGSEGWNRAIKELGQQENDAYNQLFLTGRGQANQELLTERNQPINEITALLSGGQVQQPSWVSTPQTSVSGVDTAGLQNQAYQMGPLAQYQAKQQQNNALMGGLFGLAAAPLGGWAYGGFKR